MAQDWAAHQKDVTAFPLAKPVLSQVHGYHAAARSATVFLSEQKIAFAAGSLVVSMEIGSRRQDVMSAHSDAVTCVASSPATALGASGQVRRKGAKTAEVVLWGAVGMKPHATFRFHQCDVVAVGFVQSGEVLVTVGADRDHTMALWATASEGFYNYRRKDKSPLAVTSAYKSGGVHGIVAAPGSPGDLSHFATYGASHVKFWQSDKISSALEGRRGSFGAQGPPRVVVSVAYLSSDRMVVGGCEGQVFFFEGTAATRKVQLGRLPVSALLPLPDGVLATTSSGTLALIKDGPCGGRPIELELASIPGAPDAKLQTPILGGSTWKRSSMLLVSRTYVLHLDVAGGLHQPRSCSVLLMQPSRPLTAVAVHPTEPRVWTSALDCGIRCYRSDTHEPLPERSFSASSAVTCLAISGSSPGPHASSWLAIGSEDGTLSIVGEASLRYVLRRCLSPTKAPLTCASFSSFDSSGVQLLWLAVGAADGCIHTFRFKHSSCSSVAHSGPEAVEKVATLRGHSSAVVNVSFADTLPCCYMLSVDETGQALAWDIPMSHRLPSTSVVADVPFRPWTSPSGPSVAGCWLPSAAGAGGPAPGAYEEAYERPLGCSSSTFSATMMGSAKGAGAAPSAWTPAAPTLHTEKRPRARPASAGAIVGRGKPQVAKGERPSSVDPSWPRPNRHCCEIPGRNLVAVYGPQQPCGGLRLLPYPCPAAPRPGSETTLKGPVGTITGISYHPYSDALLAASDTILYTWSMPRPTGESLLGEASPAAAAETLRSSSPARPRRYDVLVETPQGARRALPKGAQAPSSASPYTPPRRQYPGRHLSPGKENAPAENVLVPPEVRGLAKPLNFQAKDEEPFIKDEAPLPAAKVVSPALSTTSSLRARPAEAWGERSILVPNGPESERGSTGRRFEAPVAGKVGSPQVGGMLEAVSATQRVHDENVLRARSVQRRQHFDAVGALLGRPSTDPYADGGPRHLLYVPAGGYKESSVGRFLVRSRDSPKGCEIEVHLPGGHLKKLSRNPHNKTLTVQGQVLSSWALSNRTDTQFAEGPSLETLVLQLPATVEVSEPPVRVDRHFEDGQCFITFSHRTRAAGTPTAGGPPKGFGRASQETIEKRLRAAAPVEEIEI
eukprot:CAMPEP_0206547910 /NCGR_PEP_ID=MMETSP0325_2-20121206/13573_1 /ASSEMBLY_ACC=CAM_ASM_000347 /TAXON_ID=2866 /ORGANISM="Crypthecodinium cohnii, Strain Seligo" /LENGTH=1123 /DNA_ID=CAMNT_0054047297 /DNA_START=181 /DNA_END=3552 /DNA_ORIENTATION=+